MLSSSNMAAVTTHAKDLWRIADETKSNFSQKNVVVFVKKITENQHAMRQLYNLYIEITNELLKRLLV